MIHALPRQRNIVILENEARTQFFHGILWLGSSDRNPSLTIVESQTRDKPINVQGYDLIMHEGNRAAYGDKRLLRHGIDAVDPGNKLLFYSLFPCGAESQLLRWLVRKTGDMVSNEGVLRMAQFIRRNPHHVTGWCSIVSDLFRPEIQAYEAFSEPSEADVRAIMKHGRMARLPDQRVLPPDPTSRLQEVRNAFLSSGGANLAPVAVEDASDEPDKLQEVHPA